MYEDGEHTIRHSHFPSDFSAVYYVDVEPGCAPVLFEVPQNDGVNDKGGNLTLQPRMVCLLFGHLYYIMRFLLLKVRECVSL